MPALSKIIAMKFIVLFLPLMYTTVAFAHDGGPAGHHGGINNLQDLIFVIVGILQLIAPIMVALALLYFFWGVANFLILHADSDTEREKGRSIMLWGVIALFVMVSIWGILGVLENTFF